MIALAIAAALLTPQAVEAGPAEEEVVVLARKLGDWRGTAKPKNGRHVCRTRKSSGDKDVDAVACAALEHCVAEAQPAVKALVASKPPKSRRVALTGPINRQLAACLKATHETELQRLADRRVAAKPD